MYGMTMKKAVITAKKPRNPNVATFFEAKLSAMPWTFQWTGTVSGNKG